MKFGKYNSFNESQVYCFKETMAIKTRLRIASLRFKFNK